MTINDKYLLFHRIQPKLHRRARIYAGGDEFTKKEILAATADLFVARYQDTGAGEGGAVALASAWMVDVVRDLRGPRSQRGRSGQSTDPEECLVVTPPPAPAADPLPEEWQVWECLPAREQVGMLAEVIRRVLAGDDLANAGATVGWTPVQTTRELARLGQRITGDRPARYTSRRPVRLPVLDAA